LSLFAVVGKFDDAILVSEMLTSAARSEAGT
jgi:hypothetical protein